MGKGTKFNRRRCGTYQAGAAFETVLADISVSVAVRRGGGSGVKGNEPRRQHDLREPRAVEKCLFSDRGQQRGQGQIHEACAVGECFLADGGHGVVGERREAAAVTEGETLDGINGLGQVNIFELEAAAEHAAFERGYWSGDSDAL